MTINSFKNKTKSYNNSSLEKGRWTKKEHLDFV